MSPAVGADGAKVAGVCVAGGGSGTGRHVCSPRPRGPGLYYE